MIIKNIDVGVLSQTTTLVKLLTLNSCKCQHTNIVKVSNIENQQEYTTPQISTLISEQYENCIRRQTEVKYMRKRYLIKDIYLFKYDQLSTTDRNVDQLSVASSVKKVEDQSSFITPLQQEKLQSKKLCFFQKHLKSGNRLSKRNTKNLPKNFYKGFLNYMQTQQNKHNEKWNQVIKEVKSLQNNGKYNNILIQKLLSNSMIAPYFKMFLMQHAQEWINNSKINDKEIHIQAIKIYLLNFDKYSYAEQDHYSSES